VRARILSAGFRGVAGLGFAVALSREQDLAGLEDLHLPAGAGGRVVAQLAANTSCLLVPAVKSVLVAAVDVALDRGYASLR
jgi:hypothetical protein